MRVVVLAILVALAVPAIATAQTPSATSPTAAGLPPAAQSTSAPAARTRGGEVTKDEYIERARRAAERRFDRMDTNHDGILTADERRAAREERAQRRGARSRPR